MMLVGDERHGETWTWTRAFALASSPPPPSPSPPPAGREGLDTSFHRRGQGL